MVQPDHLTSNSTNNELSEWSRRYRGAIFWTPAMSLATLRRLGRGHKPASVLTPCSRSLDRFLVLYLSAR